MLYESRQFHCIRKKDDTYKDIPEYVEPRFDTSTYELDKLSPKEKKKKSKWINERWIRLKIVTKFAGLRAKSCSYLIDEGNGNEKAIGTKKYVIKINIKFENYK